MLKLNSKSLSDGAEDFPDRPVPAENRRPSTSLLFVWLGFIFIVISMSIGGFVAALLPFKDAIIAILIGNAILSILAFATGYFGAESGLSFAQLVQKAFPGISWRIVILYVPIVLIGWYAFNSTVLGSYLVGVIPLLEPLESFIPIGLAIIFSITAALGIRYLAFASYILVPVFFVISIFGVYQASVGNFGDNAGNVEELAFSSEAFLNAIGIVTASWLFTVLCAMPDITRWARSPLAGGTIAAIGIIVGNVLAQTFGAWAASSTGLTDPSAVLAALGSVSLVGILAVAGIWSSNDSNMYSSSLGMVQALSGSKLGMSRSTVVFILATIGGIVATLIKSELDFVAGMLQAIQISAPALGGAVFCCYIVTRNKPNKKVHPTHAWAAWIIGAVATYFVSEALRAPVGILVGASTWLLFNGKINRQD